MIAIQSIFLSCTSSIRLWSVDSCKWRILRVCFSSRTYPVHSDLWDFWCGWLVFQFNLRPAYVIRFQFTHIGARSVMSIWWMSHFVLCGDSFYFANRFSSLVKSGNPQSPGCGCGQLNTSSCESLIDRGLNQTRALSPLKCHKTINSTVWFIFVLLPSRFLLNCSCLTNFNSHR